MGLHGFSFGELIFDNCRVPADNMLGAEGDGLPVAYSSSVLYGRPNLTAVSLGIHQALVDETVAFAAKRHRYGKPLYEVPTVKIKVGQMQSRLMTARLAAYHAAHLLDQGEPCDAELMNAKLINVELALDTGRAAMEVHAASGLFTDNPVERYLRTRTTSSPRPAPRTSNCCGWARWRPRDRQGSVVAAAGRLRAPAGAPRRPIGRGARAASAAVVLLPRAPWGRLDSPEEPALLALLLPALQHRSDLLRDHALDVLDILLGPRDRLGVDHADRAERHPGGRVLDRRAQVGADTQLSPPIAGEPRVGAHVRERQRRAPADHVRAEALIELHLAAGCLPVAQRLRAAGRGQAKYWRPSMTKFTIA